MNKERITGKMWNGRAYSCSHYNVNTYTDLDMMIDSELEKRKKNNNDRRSTENTQTVKNYD